MRLSFIYPPFHEIKNQPSIKEVSKNYGVYPPINLAYVAAVARHAGHEIQLIDANALGLKKEEILHRVRRFSPDAILFTVTTYLFHQTLGWIRYLKRNTDAKIIVGGVHVGLYPKETLSHKEIDYGILGDCENTMPRLLDALSEKKQLNKISHIAYRGKGKVIVTGPGEYSNFLKGVYPTRDLLPNNRYFEFISQRKNFTGLITSRGCPFNCTCCEQASKDHFWNRDVKDVIEEIEQVYHRFKVREIDFFDPIFTLQKSRTLELCKEIAGLNLDLEFSIRTRTDKVDKELLSALKRAGCKRIYYGIESSDAEVLRRLNKNTNIRQVRRALWLTKKHGIDTFGYFMLGCDGDTLQTIRRTVDFSLRLDLDFAQYNKTTSLAGTEMYNRLMQKTGDDFWARYTLHKTEPDWILPKLGTSLSDAVVEREIARAYRKFYFRPSYVIRRLAKLRSVDELTRYSKAALSFL